MDAHDLIDIEPNPNVEDFRPGDTVRVSTRVKEGDRVRTQVFEGVVLRRRGKGPGASFTVRRVTHEVGVERTFLTNSPAVEAVEVARYGSVRRARLYYLRAGRGERPGSRKTAGAHGRRRPAVADRAAGSSCGSPYARIPDG